MSRRATHRPTYMVRPVVSHPTYNVRLRLIWITCRANRHASFPSRPSVTSIGQVDTGWRRGSNKSNVFCIRVFYLRLQQKKSSGLHPGAAPLSLVSSAASVVVPSEYLKNRTRVWYNLHSTVSGSLQSVAFLAATQLAMRSNWRPHTVSRCDDVCKTLPRCAGGT